MIHDQFEVEVAFWVKINEDGLWRLYIASPAVDPKKLGEALRIAYAALAKIPECSVSPSEITLLTNYDPIARDVVAVRDGFPSKGPKRYHGKRLGNMATQELWIYARQLPIKETTMAERRPSVFIGSSSKGHGIAEAIQANLEPACESVIWSQGIFGLSEGTLESLVQKADEFDFAVLVLTPDDMTHSNGNDQASPRDNVLLELGLFMGKIGRTRTFVVLDRNANIKMPSDMAGVTVAHYQQHSSGNLLAALGAASTRIKAAIQEQGTRERPRIGFDVDQTTQFQIIADLMDEAALQFLILMHEQNVVLHKESMFASGIRYQYVNLARKRTAGDGSFSVSGLCNKLPDAALLQQDLRDNVSLTARGHEFAAWLVERGHKADYFRTGVGGWGGEPPAPGFPSYPGVSAAT